MMMPFNYSYRNKNENVRTLSLEECTRMHACIHALIMYNAYSLSLLSSRSPSRDCQSGAVAPVSVNPKKGAAQKQFDVSDVLDRSRHRFSSVVA